MPVTLITAKHAGRKWTQPRIESKEELLEQSCPGEFKKSKWIIQTSASQRLFDESHIVDSSNGWVWSVIEAYGRHHHLTIRPEDVWFSILSQVSFYINTHAEELRDYFVAHEGRKHLTVVDVGTIHSVDFGRMAQRMANLIQENVKDPELQTWIMPNWSTTTVNDQTVASILMMGSMQKYFSYEFKIICGVPSVTLLGTRADWEDMLQRLDKLPKLGDEPAAFATLLRPILKNFIASFDPEPAPSVLVFWDSIANVDSSLCGFNYLSGWITAFCFWDEEGKMVYNGPLMPHTRQEHGWVKSHLELDGVRYHIIDTEDVPPGFASVPVRLDDNGKIHNTTMVAGLIGMQVTSSGKMIDGTTDHADNRYYKDGKLLKYHPAEATEQPGLDSLQALSGWFMYDMKTEEEMQKDKTRK